MLLFNQAGHKIDAIFDRNSAEQIKQHARFWLNHSNCRYNQKVQADLLKIQIWLPVDSQSTHPMFEPLLVQDRFFSILVTRFSMKFQVIIFS